MSTEALVVFKAQMIGLAQSYCGSNIDKSDFYLHREYLKAVKSLRNNDNIIISKPDQGARVVILNKHDYINKMGDIINDTSKFTILGSVDKFDKTAIQEQCILHELFGFYKEHLLPKNIYEKICSVGS